MKMHFKLECKINGVLVYFQLFRIYLSHLFLINKNTFLKSRAVQFSVNLIVCEDES